MFPDVGGNDNRAALRDVAEVQYESSEHGAQ